MFEDTFTIIAYTRKQAVDDGVMHNLSELSEVPKEHYKYPVYCTAEVMSLINGAVSLGGGQSLNGIVHDLLWMSRKYYKEIDPSLRVFKCAIKGQGELQFKMQIGPNDIDDPSPALTLMMSWED